MKNINELIDNKTPLLIIGDVSYSDILSNLNPEIILYNLDTVYMYDVMELISEINKINKENKPIVIIFKNIHRASIKMILEIYRIIFERRYNMPEYTKNGFVNWELNINDNICFICTSEEYLDIYLENKFNIIENIL